MKLKTGRASGMIEESDYKLPRREQPKREPTEEEKQRAAENLA